jgi:2-dehydro-3-deoxyphosphooctonate aldolase (KDO 8-P synthase)
MNGKKNTPMVVIAGPCVLEDEGLVIEVASSLAEQLDGLPIEFYFKASFDKANRTSIDGFRGPGMREGLKLLSRVRAEVGVPILTDFHTPEQAEPVADVVDYLQIPAFLCRQTDLIVAGAEAALRRGRRLNVKKGQFLAPWDAKNIVEKAEAVRAQVAPQLSHQPRRDWLTLTERGTSFGYNALVVDMVSFQVMSRFGVPVIHDATHSVQSPGGGAGGKSTGGKREYIETLARAAMASGAGGVFLECHPNPAVAKSDGPNAFYLERVGAFIRQLLEFRELARRTPYLLPEVQGS